MTATKNWMSARSSGGRASHPGRLRASDHARPGASPGAADTSTRSARRHNSNVAGAHTHSATSDITSAGRISAENTSWPGPSARIT